MLLVQCYMVGIVRLCGLLFLFWGNFLAPVLVIFPIVYFSNMWLLFLLCCLVLQFCHFRLFYYMAVVYMFSLVLLFQPNGLLRLVRRLLFLICVAFYHFLMTFDVFVQILYCFICYIFSFNPFPALL